MKMSRSHKTERAKGLGRMGPSWTHSEIPEAGFKTSITVKTGHNGQSVSTAGSQEQGAKELAFVLSTEGSGAEHSGETE